MGGFALALGGAGQAAQQYSQQMRQILESRRQDFANLMQQAAQTESDPDTRASMLQHAMDAASGKPMGKIMQDVSGTLQKRVKDEQAFQKGVQGIKSAVGQPSATPPPAPSGATGSASGTGGNALPNVAQTATSPVVRPANGGQILAIPPPVGASASTPASTVTPPPVTATPAPLQTPPDINPVADVSQLPPPPPNLSVQGGAGAGPVPPVTAIALPVTAGIPGLPTPENPADIYREIMTRTAPGGTTPLWNAPANRAALQAELSQRLSHQETLRQALEAQQATLAYKRNAVENLKKTPAWNTLPDFYKASLEAEAGGLAAPPFGAAMIPHMVSNGSLGTQAPPGTMEYGTNKPVDPNTLYRVMYNPAYGTDMWQPIAAQTGVAQTIDGPELYNRRTAKTIAPVEGAATPSAVTYHLITLPNGQTALVNEAGVATNVPPVPTGGVNPSFVTSTSTSTQPGAPPTTTTRTKGTGRVLPVPATAPPGNTIAPAIPPASHGGSIPPAGGGGPKPVEFNDPLAEANYKNYKAGGVAPTGRQLQGVQLYAQSHGLPMPSVTNSAGQKSVAIIDPVIQEVNDAIEKLNNLKGNPSLATDYVKYKNGFSTPYDDLFTNLSFESLRSAASALQGMNSRAYPIISRALQHTPNLDRLGGFNPDSISLMKDKLNSIKGILQQARGAAANDEAKSGVIPSVVANPGRGGLAPPPGATAAPIIQHSPSTGAYRYSTDGGSTWQAGQPPQ